MRMEVDVALKPKYLERNEITLQTQINSHPKVTIQLSEDIKDESSRSLKTCNKI